ncbi:thioester domain-containing protein [Goodfellowiella coeruleoviolacea]|uniref:LPXTG-motif cell wall anchor domain-containing protein/TQXA domain-containing protein n=1 Tax=Goodfellowiella coeruleoviolacea TaxID=334858 RepID=A0AAE3KFI5_9PSEU|nr:thioester domain-containing protein [Goodfellowiella coeruleoviolacea]MCP2164449.1 LPXTG-motif cell wall anchor domain-containing protein/TQXA domain-containing protein [Goodfellowiella coeruleoviolacea]
MASRFTLMRVGGAILGASVALMTSALPAAAATTAHIDPHGGEGGYQVRLTKPGQEVSTSLIGLRVDGDKPVKTYCVELHVSVDSKVGMVEVPWDKYPEADSPFHKNRDKINWILHHSYPSVQPAQLSAKVGKNISSQEAITATQAAIWHFSDSAELDRGNATPRNPDASGDVVALYDYLTGRENVGIGEQPSPTLTIEPTSLEGKAGELIGPFAVTTTAESVTLEAQLPQGVTLTDGTGKEFEKPANNTYKTKDAGTSKADVYVKVPRDAKAGEAKFTIKADAKLDKGRLFVGSGGKTQSLIVALPQDVKLSAQATAKWTAGTPVTSPSVSTPSSAPSTSASSPAPSSPAEVVPSTSAPVTTSAKPAPAAGGGNDDLAQTGASIFWPVVIGVVLVGAGAGALVLQRRRKGTSA